MMPQNIQGLVLGSDHRHTLPTSQSLGRLLLLISYALS